MKAALRKGRALKIVLCLCFLSIFVALLLIDRHSPAKGYELSIYEALPATVWICLIAALAGGTGIVVHQAFAGQKSKHWLLAFFTLVFVGSIIVLLPALRGYTLYSAADTVGHIGWTDEIVLAGHFGSNNRYPITHMLTAQLALVSGTPPAVVVKYLGPLFTVLFMLFGYLLASAVVPHKGHALLAAAATALVFNYYHVSIYPQGLAVMILPMVFYFYFKGFGQDRLPSRVGLVMMLLLLTYFHPAPAAVLIVCLLALEVAKAMWRARGGPAQAPTNQVPDRISFEPALISSITFITWISSYSLFGSVIYKLLGWVEREIETIPHVENVDRLFETQGLRLEEQIVLGLKMYGHNAIYVALSAMALLIVAWGFLRRRDDVKSLFALSMPFLISGPAWIFIFTGTTAVTVGRLLSANIMMWATPVLAAFALYEMFRRWRKLAIVAVTTILLCAAVVGIFGVYQSPHILQASWQVTEQDIQGSRWFAAHGLPPYRGWFSSLGVPYGFGGAGKIPVPEHFGYPGSPTIGSLRVGSYMLLGERARLTSAHPTLSETNLSPGALSSSGFSPSDFQRLEQDPTIHRVYANGELEVFRVTHVRSGE